MALVIPADIGLFLFLQDALKSIDGHRVRLVTHTHAFLQESSWIDVVALLMVVGSDGLNINTYVFSGKEAVGTGMGPPCVEISHWGCRSHPMGWTMCGPWWRPW
jgi:hypothetical protein